MQRSDHTNCFDWYEKLIQSKAGTTNCLDLSQQLAVRTESDRYTVQTAQPGNYTVRTVGIVSTGQTSTVWTVLTVLNPNCLTVRSKLSQQLVEAICYDRILFKTFTLPLADNQSCKLFAETGVSPV